MTNQHASKWVSLATAVVLALAALPAATPAKVAEAAPVPQPGTWPFYRYDLQRTNRVPPSAGQANITQPAIKWAYPVGGAPEATVADITGQNGVPDGQPEIIAWGGGRVRAYDSSTGDLIWISPLLTGLRWIAFVGDLDGNGTVEVAAASEDGTNPNWHLYALSGQNGQILSRVSSFLGNPLAPLIADPNGDGRMEVFETGGSPPTQRKIFTFQNGVSQPALLAAPNVGDRSALIEDFDGNGTKDIIYVGNPLIAVNPSTWGISGTQTVTATPQGIPAAIMASGLRTDLLGEEILIAWSAGSLTLYRNVPGPGYNFSLLWARSIPTGTAAGSVVIPQLDGSGNFEAVWSYFDTSANRWRTEVVQTSNGAVVQTIDDWSLCTSGVRWWATGDRYSNVHSVADLDANPSDSELILCQRPGISPQINAIRAYNWTAGQLQPLWTRPNVSIAPSKDLVSQKPGTTQLMPAFAADFNLDGYGDVLAKDSQGRLVVLSGISGQPVFTYTPQSGVKISVEHIGNFDSNANDPEVLITGSDGYLRYLDRTLSQRRAMYSGTGTAYPYVVNTNPPGSGTQSDTLNEIVLLDAGEQIRNLNPYLANHQTPPSVNWVWDARPSGSEVMPREYLANLDGSGLWEYVIADTSQPPTITLRVVTKHPLSGSEATLSSRTFTTLAAPLSLVATGQFNGLGPDDIIIMFGTSFDALQPGNLIALNGSNLSTLWSSSAASFMLPAVGEANNDAIDDLVWGIDLPSFESRIIHGGNGLTLHTSDLGRPQGMIANVDGDASLEAIFAASRDNNGRFRVVDLSPGFPVAFTRQIPGAMFGIASVAQVDNSPGLEIVYRTQAGLVGAMSGVSGVDVYTRALGVAFNTVTCETFINTPASYAGWLLEVYEQACPGAARFADIKEIVVADIDGNDGGRDEILAASDNGYLYALNAENGSLAWAYNFYYPVRHIAVANIDDDPSLEVLVSVADGFLYALEQQTFARPALVWDGGSAVINDDIDVQLERACYRGHWTVTQDSVWGLPNGFRVALRDEGGALMTQGYVNVPRTGATVQGVELCAGGSNPQLVSPLVPGRRYFLEVIAYQGGRASGPSFSDMVLVAATGDFGLSAKSATPATAAPGDVVTWTVVVRNTGVAAAGAQMFDPIPLNTSYVNGSATATSGSVSYEGANNRIVWDAGGVMPPGEAVTITFQTQVTTAFSSGLIRNRAEVINQSTGARTFVEATASVGSSNLSSAVKTVNRAEAQLGDVLTYTIRVTNTGTAAASGTLIDDVLPSTLTFQGNLTATGGSGSASYSALQNRVRWTGTLNPGQAVQVSFRAQVNAANAVVDNCATVRDVLNGTFDRCARTVVGAGGPSLAGSYKTSDRLSYATSDQITYTIGVINDGTTTASNIQLRDPLPAGLSNVQVGATAGTVSVVGGVVQWNGSLLPGGQALITIRANLNRPDGVLKNTAVMTDVTTGRVYTLTREVLVGTAPSLNGEKFAEPLSAAVGEEITYTIRLENTGNAVATSAVVTDPLPFGTSYVAGSAQANRGVVSYNAAQQRLEWSGPVWITAPTFITWRVKVEAGAPAGSLIVNEARSFDGVSDVDTFVATTAVDVPAGKALIRTFVYSGTGATAMAGVQVSASGLATVTGNTDASGYAGLLVDATVTPTNYAVFQVVPSGYVNLTPNPVGVAGVVEGGVYNAVFRNALAAPVGFGWVRGVVFNDANGDGQRNIFSEVGLGGWTVSASDGQAMQTLADGSYFFLLASGGRVITQANQTGWVATTPAVVPVTVASQGAHEVNFGVWQCPPGSPVCADPPAGYAWLFGYVYRDADATLNAPDGLIGPGDDPLALVDAWATIGTFSGSDATDASGFYYMQVPAGDGVVSYTLPSGYIGLTPAAVPVSAPDGGRLRVDFGVISATQCAAGTGVVNGFVYSDTTPVGQFLLGVDGPTLTEATVTFGAQTQRTNWMYAFACVPSGAGTVSASNPAGYTNTTPNSVGVTVPSQGSVSAHFGKAFQNIPLGLRYAYVPIARREP